jgi:diguanylate cyclase (GGDEF)-like protein
MALNLPASFVALPTGLKVLGLVGLLTVVSGADYLTGADLTLRAVYLLPVGLAAWTVGPGLAALIGVFSVVFCLYLDFTAELTRARPTFVYSDAVARALVYAAATVVIDRLRDAQARLDRQARTDPLTGLYNRRGFQELGAREIERAKRRGTPLVMVGVDLDGFKGVNDTLGHAEGDRVLVEISRVLKAGRVTDLAARLGGDEFAILLPETDSALAKRALERIHVQLTEAMAREHWAVTFSVGVATYRAPPVTVDEMIAAADHLMYEAKRSARGTTLYRELAPKAVVSEPPALGRPALKGP